MKPLAILSLLALGACTAAPGIVMTAADAVRYCRTPEGRALIVDAAKRAAPLTPIDGEAVVRGVCGADE